MTDIRWNFYRDDGQGTLLEKARRCIEQYRQKHGRLPSMISISEAARMPDEDKAALAREGVFVVQTVPAWAKDEIWLGVDLEEQPVWTVDQILAREG
jgi:hypothetical protein